MYLDRKFGLSLSLSEITLLFDLSLYLDRTLAQRKAKSKVKVAQCKTFVIHKYSQRLYHSVVRRKQSEMVGSARSTAHTSHPSRHTVVNTEGSKYQIILQKTNTHYIKPKCAKAKIINFYQLIFPALWYYYWVG